MSKNKRKINAQSIPYGPIKFHKISQEQLIIQEMKKAPFSSATQE
jgi:hypothetical protein